MAKHKQKMEEETDAEKRSELAKKKDSWKRALTEVADLKGKDAKDRKETEFIKELFKHIACYFVRSDRDVTETILNACDINTRSGITHLTERCLLSIGPHNKLMMHQLVQEMGRDLVRQESPHKPWERSRLWCHEESFKVLAQKKRTENLVGFALDMRMLKKENLSGSLQLETDALTYYRG
ncbi:hypothetical protein L1987_83775 [Smallanthus sonchifolius]|uniref:Uncharacterized protein n=1 Tax=Smallanthus sonchifolius TaxID=185202 RepID=A0ACB8YDI5_9ASTR|nr:hypothetical protein L1987_83775 [Smallanthus sonchifolius]